MSSVRNMKPVKLNKVVDLLVDKWSKDYLVRAKNGEFEYMLKVAEIQSSKAGWGRIRRNPYQSRRWLEYAASLNDPYALYTLKNMIIAEEIRKDKIYQMKRWAVLNHEHPSQWRTPNDLSPVKIKGYNVAGHSGHAALNSGPDSMESTNKPGTTFRKWKNYDQGIGGAEGNMNSSDRSAEIERFRMTEAFALNKGQPWALTKFPSIWAAADMFRAVKGTLDGKMQHRPTDLIPRPISEYVHTGIQPDFKHVPATMFVSAAAEADVLKHEQSFDTKKHVRFGGLNNYITAPGTAIDRILKIGDNMDKYNAAPPGISDDSITLREIIRDTYGNEGDAYPELRDADLETKTNNRVAINIKDNIIYASESYTLPPTQAKFSEEVTTSYDAIGELASATTNIIKILRANDVDDLHDDFLPPEFTTNLKDIYGDDGGMSDAPYQFDFHDVVDDHSDIDAALSEWITPDSAQVFGHGVGLNEAADHRFPYRSIPSRDQFSCDPIKVSNCQNSMWGIEFNEPVLTCVTTPHFDIADLHQSASDNINNYTAELRTIARYIRWVEKKVHPKDFLPTVTYDNTPGDIIRMLDDPNSYPSLEDMERIVNRVATGNGPLYNTAYQLAHDPNFPDTDEQMRISVYKSVDLDPKFATTEYVSQDLTNYNKTFNEMFGDLEQIPSQFADPEAVSTKA